MRAIIASCFIGAVALAPLSGNADTTTAPTIITGGPYTDVVGQSFSLNEMLVNNEDNGAYPFSYRTVVFGGTNLLVFSGSIASGGSLDINPVISWSTLVSDGLSNPGTYTINFQASDSYYNVATATTTLSIVSAPEIDPASAASGLTSLLGGLMVMRGRRSKEPLRVAA